MLCRFGMTFELLELAVHRQEELGMRQCEHEFLLFLAGMTRNMGIIHVLVDHFCAQAQKTVDHLGHCFFRCRGWGGPK